MNNVAALLRASPLPPLEARILLGHVLGWRRTELITRSDEPLDAGAVARFQALEARRVTGEPVAQLIGAREFFGLDFEVTPDVLIPRPETELLVETALAADARGLFFFRHDDGCWCVFPPTADRKQVPSEELADRLGLAQSW